MYKNNFDQSSTGTNIELSCSYDCHLSRLYFEENFKIIQSEGYRTFTKAYYIENGNVPDHDAITFTLGGTETEIEAALTAEGYSRDEIKAMIPGEPFDILETLYGDKITLLNYEDFDHVYAPLKAVPSKTIIKINIRGYSQGDYAEVFYCPEDLEKAWGKPPVESELDDLFTRLFYDAPIFCRFTVNDETDYDYSEYMPDSYKWDKEAFAKIVSEKSGIAYETLLNMLPEYPDYQ